MWGWESLLLQVEESKDCIERRTECRRVKLELPGGNPRWRTSGQETGWYIRSCF